MDSGSLPPILILNWRDRTHPEGGGSELYAEQVAAYLARRGHAVTLFCAAHTDAPRRETTPDGVRIVRGGGRHTVYASAAWHYLRGHLGRPALVIDTQNGLPFFSRLWARCPMVLLVHHVHREQWRVVLGPTAARFGWWIESWLSPRLHRRDRYVTVSQASASELAEIGVNPANVAIIHNGTPPPDPRPQVRTPHPSLLVLGRLVPHKRIEIALRALQHALRDRPDTHLTIAGQGWWLEPLQAETRRLGLSDHVTFAGHVTEAHKQRLLAESWALLVPSLKEGWGLSVIEAAAHGTPAIAFHNAGGVTESIINNHTGLLATTEREFIDQTAELLANDTLRSVLGDNARTHAGRYTWDETGKQFAKLIDELVSRRG